MEYQDIRNAFSDYFCKNDHTEHKSFSLIPENDQTLLFTNSGMVGFKEKFLSSADFPNQFSIQKCIRAGGKHNDLENVGYTKRHHTFFEMLGNFSFGRYFKEKAIFYAWDFLINILKINKNKLIITVYHNDQEAFDLWKKISNFPDEKIIKISSADNYWSMGNSGPCGPCSEIFYDQGEKLAGGLPGSANEGDRFLEIWNLVFMEFSKNNAEITPLSKKCIDTGSGLERLACVMQNALDNYDTSIFQAIIREIKANYSTNSEDFALNYKIAADHMRSTVFLISEGILPSNEGRGYVLRRIMRRAMRYLHQIDEKEVKMHTLVDVIILRMKQQYPEIAQTVDLIKETIKKEEENFKENLSHGIELICKELSIETIQNINKSHKISGETTFKLYDTYGFPIDMTLDICRNGKALVDINGFNKCMEEQKNRSKKNWKGEENFKNDEIFRKFASKFAKTEQDFTKNSVKTKIIGIISDNSEVYNIDTKSANSTWILLDSSCFYYESGGQKSDIGFIKFHENKAKITDVQLKNGLIWHKIAEIKGELSKNDEIEVQIDISNRNELKKGHTATHLLQAALKKHISQDTKQMGSSVHVDGLRFDFNSSKNLTKDEISTIEQQISIWIQANIPIEIKQMSKNEAINLGATANFGDKYDDFVRVIEIPKASIELCGGMHVENTGEIADFKILKSSGISSGIYRITATCGKNAHKTRIIEEISILLNTDHENLHTKVAEILDINKQLIKEINELKIAKLSANDMMEKGKLLYCTQNCTLDELKLVKNAITKRQNDTKYHGLLLMIMKTQENISFFLHTKNDNINIAKLFKTIRESHEITGGGNKKFATFSCNPTKVENILEIIINFAK